LYTKDHTIFTHPLYSSIMTHFPISPAIFYWGTPVVLVTTTDRDGTPNIGPKSSAWWLGNRCVLGLDGSSQTTMNILSTKECVLNLPDHSMVSNVKALARTTGTKEIPESKINRGYRYEKDKFKIAQLTPQPSATVTPPRIQECPVQMEAELVGIHKLVNEGPAELKGLLLAIEVMVLQTHVLDELRMDGHANREDTDKWRPMIMSFQRLYGLRDGELASSTLAGIDAESYRLSSCLEGSNR
jgi:flavin reductase (DIM6/NTAB) family NADH-FMN oxidoreductase RutF